MRVAVCIPCYNEESSIGYVVRSFSEVLPDATVYVCDNNSTDRTAIKAKEAGALVFHEYRQGKGFALQRLFADVNADIYIIVDGDGTYCVQDAPQLIKKLVTERLDMVVGCRANAPGNAYRPGHVIGNKVLTNIVQALFGRAFTDMLSGYRAFTRRFVKSFPLLGKGFEVETLMTIHALQMRIPSGEIQSAYGARIDGSKSKLNTYRDGFRILATILYLLLSERPRFFWGIFSAMQIIVAIILAVPLLLTWIQTGLVPRFPTAILCTGITILSGFTMGFGILMDNISRARLEAKRLAYLNINPMNVEYK